MASQKVWPFSRRTRVLILGLSLIAVTATQSAESVSPSFNPLGSSRPLVPADFEKAEKTMRESQAQYESRPRPTLPTGVVVVDVVGEQFGGSHRIENMWRGIVNGEEVRVYAGAMRFDPRDDTVKYDPQTVHGFVIIQRGQLGKPNMRANKVHTPTAVGSLRIVGANGNVLTLQSRQGESFSLNVETEELESGPSAPSE